MKFNRVLAFLLVLTLVPIPFLPSAYAGHLTWTDYGNLTTSTTAGAGAPIDAVPTSDSSFIFTQSDATPNDQFAWRCNISAACIAGTVYTNVDSGGGMTLDGVSSTRVVGCLEDDTTDDVIFAKTNDGGTFWSTTIIDTGVKGAFCDVGHYSNEAFVAVWAEDTGNEIRFSRSTDFGVTWSAAAAVETCAGCASAASSKVAVKNSTNWVVASVDVMTLRSCRTSNAGSSWTCQQHSTSALNHFSIEYESASDTFWLVYSDTSTSDTLLLKSFDNGGSWGTATVQNTLAATIASTDIWVHNATHAVVSIGRSSVGLGYVATTEDGGATWTLDTAFTLGETTQNAGGSTAVILSGGGEVVAGFSFDPTTGASLNVQSQLVKASFLAGDDIAASATAAVTILVGFDVDPTGTTVVARTEGGSKVAIFDGLGLTLTSSPEIETNCDLGFYEDAVMARYGGTLVGFLNCDATGEAQFFSIRESDGSAPELDDFTDCASFDDCPFNIDLATFPSDQTKEALGQMGQIQDFPIDYSHKATAPIGGGVTASHVAWAFATQECDEGVSELAYCDGSEPGDVGVALLNARVTLSDSEQDEIEAFSTSIVNDFCVGLDNGEYYLAAGDTGIPGRVWTVTFPLLTGSINQFGVDITPGNTFLSDVTSLACGGGQILAVSDTAPDAAYLLTRTGSVLDSITGITATDRGATISEEFVLAPGEDSETCFTASTGTGNCVQYGAVYDAAGPTVLIYNLTGGSIVEVGSIPAAELPGGSFFAIRMDRSAQNIWVATTTTIARYFIVNETTLVPVGNPSTPGGGGVVPSEGTGLFGGSGATIGTAFGVGAFGGNLFLGALLMGIVAYGVGTGYGNVIDSNTMQPRFLRVNPWAAVIGAAVGFLVAWGFGFFSTAVVFSIIALVAMIVGIRLWTARGG